MKCIQCGTDNNFQDRTGNQGRCKNCNHSFAFEPTTMGSVKITDPFFAKAIADISANNTLFFTHKHFLYLIDKRRKLQSVFHKFYWLFSYLIIFLIFLFNSSLLLQVIVNIFFILLLYNNSTSSKVNYNFRKSNTRNLKIIG